MGNKVKKSIYVRLGNLAPLEMFGLTPSDNLCSSGRTFLTLNYEDKFEDQLTICLFSRFPSVNDNNIINKIRDN